MSKDIERFWLTEDNKLTQWPLIIAALKQRIVDGCQIEIRKKRETRAQLQNRLAKRWAKQFADQQGLDPQEMWGSLKWDYLRPLKLADDAEHDTAVLEITMVEAVVADMMDGGQWGESERELRVMAAERVIRSRDISPKLFAQWLTQIQQAAGQAGCVLISRRDELDYAIAEERKVA